ncbi:MAG TPA: winged helix-turn-helix domain-containing protein [Bauldia sp.]|nr:winged helix-turn-helix domain-containing protein [Bauldia sp.]
MAAAVSTFGPFLFDRARMKLSRDGRSVSLGGRCTALLATLLDAGGGVVGKDTLMHAAWPGTVVEEANLTVQIAALRRALGVGADGEDWIVTVPRVGYRLLWPRAGNVMEQGAPAVAVLPFENLSPDPEQSFLADGIVEEIIMALSRFRTFAVVARSSTFVYKGRAVDVREVARDLGVRYLLEGSVRRSGDRVRIAAQLIDGASGAHLWAEKFEGAATNIFDFQDEITRSVVGLIEPQIRKAEIERARRKHPESLDAWDLYVQAVPLVYGANVPAYTEAIDLLDRALAITPDYGPALAFRSFAHEKRRTFGGAALAAPDDVELAITFAAKALEVDPDDALAMALLGWERILFRWDYGGLALCSRAVELNPNHRAVLDLTAVAHLYAGDLDQVIACGMRALQLSPGAPDAYMCMNHISSAHFSSGRFEEAAAWAQRSIDAEKGFLFSHIFLAVSNAHLGRIEEARAAMKAALAIRPDYTVALEIDDPMRFPERKKLMIDGLRMAGMPEG